MNGNLAQLRAEANNLRRQLQSVENRIRILESEEWRKAQKERAEALTRMASTAQRPPLVGCRYLVNG